MINSRISKKSFLKSTKFNPRPPCHNIGEILSLGITESSKVANVLNFKPFYKWDFVGGGVLHHATEAVGGGGVASAAGGGGAAAGFGHVVAASETAAGATTKKKWRILSLSRRKNSPPISSARSAAPEL